MKAMQTIAGVLTILVTMPIWYYLLHFILVKIGAGDLQMFLFWVYAPVCLMVQCLWRVIERSKP